MRRKLALEILLVVTFLLYAGCGRFARKSKPIEGAKVVAVQKGHLLADATVMFFDEDMSPYYTQQQHNIGPEDNSITVTADEPEGAVKCQLSGDAFTVTSGGVSSTRSQTICGRNILRAIGTCFSAGAGYIPASFVESEKPVKYEGKWYRTLVSSGQGNKGLNLTLYKSVSTKRIEMVNVEDTSDGSRLLAIGYNQRWVKKLSRSFPTKIDIFGIDQRNKKQRLLQIEYQRISAL